MLPADIKAFGVSAHAHYLGKTMKMTAALPSGETKTLLSIRDWDFGWQEQYLFANYVTLPKGTKLDVTVTYDNSAANVRNPHQPPRRVTYGINSTDEMAELWLQVLPKNPADLSYLQQDFGRHVLARRLESNRRIVESDSANVEARIKLGHALVGFGRLGEAEANYLVTDRPAGVIANAAPSELPAPRGSSAPNTNSAKQRIKDDHRGSAFDRFSRRVWSLLD